MSSLREINQLTVELPTAQGWVRPANEVSLPTRIAVMSSGRLVEIGDAEHLLHHPIQQYTRDLLAAVPEVAARH